MSVRDDLIAARAKIEDPAKWASSTRELADRSKECAVTALDEADSIEPLQFLSGILQKTPEGQARAKEGRYYPVSVFNDTHTHAEVLALFDEGIARAT